MDAGHHAHALRGESLRDVIAAVARDLLGAGDRDAQPRRVHAMLADLAAEKYRTYRDLVLASAR